MSGATAKWIRTLSQRGFSSKWAPRIIGLASVVFMAAMAASACSSENDLPAAPPLPPAVDAGGNDTGVGTPCDTGSVRDCHVYLGEHNGVVTCFNGVQKCVDGKWGYCTADTSGNVVVPPAGSPAGLNGDGISPFVLSLTDAGACTAEAGFDNPCDPTCQIYPEAPDGGITPDQQAPTLDWESGDMNDLPGNILEDSTQEPCSMAEDCQMDQYCKNPASNACAHHQCAIGTALFSTCDPCVTDICTVDPTCCIAPYTGNCLHDPCQEGSALKSSCDPCTAAICAVNKGCCVDQCTVDTDCAAGQTCLIDATNGNKCTCTALADCPTGASSCSGTPKKCNSYWGDFNCTSKVATICGKTCPPLSEWKQSCVDKVSSVCGVECQTDPPCAHDKCYVGSSLGSACDPCVAMICGIEPDCCTPGAPQCVVNADCPMSANCKNGKCVCTTDADCPAGAFCQSGTCESFSWTNKCASMVQSVCGESCPIKGNCVPWSPTDTDPNCSGVDLTVGVPCDMTVPICNRGNTDAPAGIQLVTYPPGSGELSKCNPPAGTVACTTADPIPAGTCINVTGCAGLVDGTELLINPPGAGHIAECHCDNNGSIYQTLPCGPPSCSGAATSSLVQKVSMFVALDRSTSMRTAVAGSMNTERMPIRWIPVANALKGFFADPASAGLGVAFRFWPDDNPAACDYNPACPPAGGGGCATPLVSLGTLTIDPAPMDAQEQALITQIDIRTNNPTDQNIGIFGYTPMLPALDGATAWAIARKMAFPDEKVVVVFITDGYATHCNTDTSAMAALATNAFSKGVRVYTIGIAESSPVQLSQIAIAGGGASFFLGEDTATVQNLEADLKAAMLSIRGDNITCNLTLPDGVADLSTIQVVYTPPMGMETTLPKVSSLADCMGGDGWYFDNPMTPTIAKLCPATCTNLQGQIGTKIQVQTSCLPPFAPVTYRQTYTGVCPEGTKVQWGYFTYETTVPGDAYVKFSVRTAELLADLMTAPTTQIAMAQRMPDTQICGFGGPLGCPIDLFTQLNGKPQAFHDYLELEMLLNPTTDQTATPTVLNWNITYSCPPSE